MSEKSDYIESLKESFGEASDQSLVGRAVTLKVDIDYDGDGILIGDTGVVVLVDEDVEYSKGGYSYWVDFNPDEDTFRDIHPLNLDEFELVQN